MNIIDARRARAIVRMAAAGTAVVVAAGIAGCAGSGGSGDGSVSVRFSFWGSDERAQRMQEVVDLFEDENPGIDVVPDFADWGGYWDKLATSVAGNDTPDVLMQEDRYIGDYARRGVIADLSEFEVEMSDIDAQLLSSGEIDGGQYGVPTGSNVMSMIANPEIFAKAGVEMPDDSSWTWDDYVEISQAISDGTPDGTYGTSDYSFSEVGLVVYLRQHGQNLFAEDGTLGYDDELLEEWFQRSLDLQASGAQPPADTGLALDLLDSPIARGFGAMSLTWSAQLGTLSEAVDTDLAVLRVPGESEFERAGMYFKPGTYLSQSASTENPEAAAKFIDFFVNSPEVGEIFGTELGLPGSAAVREAVVPTLSANDAAAADFVEDLGDEIVDAPPVLPEGAGDAADIMQRINAEVLFERMSPEEGAVQFRQEVEQAIS